MFGFEILFFDFERCAWDSFCDVRSGMGIASLTRLNLSVSCGGWL